MSAAPSDADAVLESLRGEAVVLDLAAPWVYLGTLKSWDAVHLVLAEADAHDLRDTATTREMYVLEAARHGVAPNRKRALVRRDAVVGLSRLRDVLT
ncbi:hypothetical protein [Alienimonas sp. DA493]|uniref:hypothetical protein n=1 Tax=Alienimonas sp. DA493 TaxID=3373605 RepID=UPI003754E6D2